MPLPPIPGLHQVVERNKKTITWQTQKAASPRTDPRIAHEAEVSAKDSTTDNVKLAQQIKENEQTIEGIEALIHTLRSSDYQSPHRTLAIRELENASMRLRRENGDPS